MDSTRQLGPSRGKLIVIEGIDGSGKATQHRLLADYLMERGAAPLCISFPNYQSPSSALVQMYLNGEIRPEADEINPFAASSFYSVDRYVSYKQTWEKEYLAGRLILADRYTTSNITHQMEKLPSDQWEAFADWLYDFEYGKLGLPRPDIVLYLDMHPEVSQKLLEKRYSGNNEKKDIHERSVDYLIHCRRAALFAAQRLDWRVIGCFSPQTMEPLPVEDIAARVREEVERLI